MSEVGERIRRAVNRLRELGAHVDVYQEKECQVHDVTGVSYRIRVSVDPSSGLALQFTISRDEDGPELIYHVDTDLYDVKDDRQQWFVSEIEDDIVTALEALASGRIMIKRGGGKTVAVFPNGSGYVRVERGRLLTSQKRYEEAAKAASGGEFQPLRL